MLALLEWRIGRNEGEVELKATRYFEFVLSSFISFSWAGSALFLSPFLSARCNLLLIKIHLVAPVTPLREEKNYGSRCTITVAQYNCIGEAQFEIHAILPNVRRKRYDMMQQRKRQNRRKTASLQRLLVPAPERNSGPLQTTFCIPGDKYFVWVFSANSIANTWHSLHNVIIPTATKCPFIRVTR